MQAPAPEPRITPGQETALACLAWDPRDRIQGRAEETLGLSSLPNGYRGGMGPPPAEIRRHPHEPSSVCHPPLSSYNAGSML